MSFSGRLGRFGFSVVLLFMILIPAGVLLIRPSQQLQAEARAQDAVEAGDYPQAIDELSLAAALAIDPAEYWSSIGEYALLAGDPHTAIYYLEKAKAAGDLELEGLLALGQGYTQVADLDHAAATLKRALASSGPDPNIFADLYQLFMESGNYSAAAEILGDMIEFEPEDHALQLELALLLAATDPDAALSLFSRLENTLPEERGALRELGLAIRRARAVSPQPEYVSLAAGRALAAAGEWKLANLAFQRAVELNPSFAEAWAYLGESEDQLNLSGDKSLEIAYALKPESPAINILYALHLQKNGDPELALSHLETAHSTDPENPKLVAELASLIAASGDIEAALTLFEQAIELAPDDSLYWKLLAGFSIQNEIRIEEIGISASRTATLLDSEDPEAFSLLGQAYLVAGNPVLAERFLLQASDLDSTYAPAAYHLGILYLTTGAGRSALEQFERVKDLAPGTDMAQKADGFIRDFLQ